MSILWPHTHVELQLAWSTIRYIIIIVPSASWWCSCALHIGLTPPSIGGIYRFLVQRSPLCVPRLWERRTGPDNDREQHDSESRLYRAPESNSHFPVCMYINLWRVNVPFGSAQQDVFDKRNGLYQHHPAGNVPDRVPGVSTS